jgi:hypothetical protein
MKEQFDHIMGIHPDGKHYKQWADKELNDECEFSR